MSSRRNGFGCADFSGLPDRNYFSRSSSRRSSRSDSTGDYVPHAFPPDSYASSRRRERGRGPPISMLNNINQFGSSSRQSSSNSHRRSRSSSQGFGSYGGGESSYEYERRPRERRGAEDLSNNATNFYDPFAGGLGTGARHRESIYGDPDLPSYRSASTYAREQFPPAYERRRSSRLYDDPPPRYNSFSSQCDSREPMQYPPTRRPSMYDRPSSRRPSESGYSLRRPSAFGDLPPPDYFSKSRR